MGSSPFRDLYKPLYGSPKNEPSNKGYVSTKKKAAPTGSPKKVEAKKASQQPNTPPKPKLAAPSLKDKGLSFYEGIAADKRLLLIIAILVIVVIVVGYLIYKQNQNKKYLSAMARRLKKLKKYAR